jgi:hypothetical protein
MSLSTTLAYLFPSIRFGLGGDCELRDDGAGVYIAAWSRPEPQPTPEEIEAARIPAALAIVIPAIKAERERRQLQGGFPVTLPGVGAVRFHSDTHSRSQHAGLFSTVNVMLMQGATQATPIGNPQVQWRMMGGEMVPLTVGIVLALMQAALLHEAAIHAAADAHIAAATAAADPLAYDYSAGWPA